MIVETLGRSVPESVWQDVRAAVEVAGSFSTADAGELAEALYADWYLGAEVADDGERPDRVDPLDLGLPDVLRAAHVDAGRWEAGWTVVGVSSKGRVAVAQNGSTRIVARVDVLPVRRPCLPPRPGDAVRIAARRDGLDAAGAFWFAYGGDWDEADLPAGVVRIYWHVRRRSSPALVGVLTNVLARSGCSYALKIAVEDRELERPDRAVLYLRADAVAEAAPAIRDAHRRLEDMLLPRTPRLALRLGDGLALAEDPETGESFGQQCCRRLADALVAARDPGRASVDLQVADVLERVAAAGLDPTRPYLRPGSTGDAWRFD